MREYHFDPEGELPVVRALIVGPKGKTQASLVFDSGCALTQLHDQLLETVGLGQSKSRKELVIGGVSGEGDSAYLVQVDTFSVLGRKFLSVEIAGVDFSKWAPAGIEGLLGWDLIKTFHFEMNGPEGLLKVH